MVKNSKASTLVIDKRDSLTGKDSKIMQRGRGGQRDDGHTQGEAQTGQPLAGEREPDL